MNSLMAAASPLRYFGCAMVGVIRYVLNRNEMSWKQEAVSQLIDLGNLSEMFVQGFHVCSVVVTECAH